MADQKAQIDWKNGVPVSRRFDDPYYSLEDGVAETRHVFLQGNGLPERLKPGFHVAELGFGTGLNLLVLMEAARQARLSGPIRYTGFEAYPMRPQDMAAALSAFPELARDAAWLVDSWSHGAVFDTELVSVELILGDANETLPVLHGRADAWFLDGFAPARNADLWSESLLAQVAQHTGAGGTAATYSAAGGVRRGLAQAGFEVERRPGFGRKRHMTVARLA
ncbi:MAG: tRNA (5-methylaminomethyl-2-thiouridine)(34)-methyltransferase MnmD [Alphaproteobacteria bacterium]|nr:tRNA (5-methylaminomethyl-2-thiouridine)(34)-methyltransferase MnmD [Alphaproteobacteria bacterium]